MMFEYSFSGSQIKISSSVRMIINSISSFVKNDFPEPGTPNTNALGFCRHSLLQKIGLFVIAFCPYQIPPLSAISCARNGMKTDALSVNNVRIIFNRFKPIGSAVHNPSSCLEEK